MSADCLAVESHRDARGFWAARACHVDAGHEGRHQFGAWQYSRLVPSGLKESEVLTRELLEPRHESRQMDRLRHGREEQIFLEQWQRINHRRTGWASGGVSLLELLLRPSGQDIPERATGRDAMVAATVIQWLGTNVGSGFLQCCLEAGKESRSLRSSWGLAYAGYHYFPDPEQEEERHRIAREITEPIRDESVRKKVRGEVAAALAMAAQVGRLERERERAEADERWRVARLSRRAIQVKGEA